MGLTIEERATLAEVVMGWKTDRLKVGSPLRYWRELDPTHWIARHFVKDWQPDLSWEQAGMVFNRLVKLGYIGFNAISLHPGPGYEVAIWKRGTIELTGESGTLPEAICRAALKVAEEIAKEDGECGPGQKGGR